MGELLGTHNNIMQLLKSNYENFGTTWQIFFSIEQRGKVECKIDKQISLKRVQNSVTVWML